MRTNTHSISAAIVETRIHDNNQSHGRSRDALAKSRGRRALARDAGEAVDIGSTWFRLVAPQLRHSRCGGGEHRQEETWPDSDRPQAVRELRPHFPGLPGAGKDAGPRPVAGRRRRRRDSPGSLSLAPNRRAGHRARTSSNPASQPVALPPAWRGRWVSVSDWIANAVSGSAWTYLLIVVVCAGDGLFPVLPSETIVFDAAVLAANDHLSIALVVVAAASGGLLGDNAAYGIGHSGLRGLAGRFMRSDKSRRRLQWGTGAARAPRPLDHRGGTVHPGRPNGDDLCRRHGRHPVEAPLPASTEPRISEMRPSRTRISVRPRNSSEIPSNTAPHTSTDALARSRYTRTSRGVRHLLGDVAVDLSTAGSSGGC